MALFGGTILTTQGRNLLAKALTGAELQFTKIQLGDGVWDSSINPEELTSLVSPKIDLPINDLSIQGDGTARIRAVLTNTGLQEGFFTRELGVFAKDPETGEEILYSVSYASNPDYIPADGVTKIEDVIDVYTVIANAQNVTAVISDTVVIATKEDIQQHNTSADAHPDIRQAIQDAIGNLSQELESFKSQFEVGLAESGYYKLPNGLIIQWGYAQISNDSNNPETPTEIPLPIAFPNTGLQVVANDVGWGRHIVSISFKDNATLQAWSYDPVNNLYPPVTGIHWIAIGY